MIRDTVERLAQVAPWLRDDIESEAALALLEADRDGHDDEWVVKRLKRFVSDDRVANARTISLNERVTDSSIRRPSSAAAPILLPSTLTPGQQKRFHRDLMIQLAASRGFSQQIISEIFGINYTRMREILQEDLRERYKTREKA